jgi:hypothetical protein
MPRVPPLNLERMGTMNKEKQRQVIAEFCGWSLQDWPGTSMGKKWRRGDQWRGLWSLPDYLNDLNAMHEAEKKLSGEQLAMFALWTAWIRDGSEKGKEPDESWFEEYIHEPWQFAFCLINTPAQYRAEALLRTIGKWEDGE